MNYYTQLLQMKRSTVLTCGEEVYVYCNQSRYYIIIGAWPRSIKTVELWPRLRTKQQLNRTARLDQIRKVARISLCRPWKNPKELSGEGQELPVGRFMAETIAHWIETTSWYYSST